MRALRQERRAASIRADVALLIVALMPIALIGLFLAVGRRDSAVAAEHDQWVWGALLPLLVVFLLWALAATCLVGQLTSLDRIPARRRVYPLFVQRWAADIIERSRFGAGDLADWTWTRPDASLDQLAAPGAATATTDPRVAEIPSATTGSATATTTVMHTLRRGEGLWSLAAEYLGAGTRWSEIVAINSGIAQSEGRVFDPNRVRAGDVVQIPIDGLTEEQQ